MPLTRLAGIAATIQCRCRVQGGRASTESFPLSGRLNPQETTTAAPRRNPSAASQPSGQPPLVAAVTTPECIPTVGDYRERGYVYRHAADKLVGVSAGGITLFGKKTSPLFLSFALSIPSHSEGRKIVSGRWRMYEADVPSMKVATAEQINQNSWLNRLVRIFR